MNGSVPVVDLRLVAASRGCWSKVRLPHKQAAEKFKCYLLVSIPESDAARLDAYPCRFGCDGWHVGKRREAAS